MKTRILIVLGLCLLLLLVGCTRQKNVSDEPHGKVTDGHSSGVLEQEGESLMSTVESLLTEGLDREPTQAQTSTQRSTVTEPDSTGGARQQPATEHRPERGSRHRITR